MRSRWGDGSDVWPSLSHHDEEAAGLLAAGPVRQFGVTVRADGLLRRGSYTLVLGPRALGLYPTLRRQSESWTLRRDQVQVDLDAWRRVHLWRTHAVVLAFRRNGFRHELVIGSSQLDALRALLAAPV